MRFTTLAIAILLASGALVVALLPEFTSRRFESYGNVVTFTVALATFVIGAGLLARRDTYSFAWLVGCLGAFGLACVGLVLLVSAPVTMGLLGFAACSLLLLVVAAAYVARTQFRRGPVPDVLTTKLGRHAVYEIDDVQLAATCPSLTPENVIGSIDVYLQNCLDTSRTVIIDLDDQLLFGSAGGISWRRPEPVQLGPSEVKVVRIPFCCAQTGGIERAAYVCVRASGARGKRVRHRRAPYAAHPLKHWQIAAIVLLASPFFWIVVWGRGGLKLNIRFSPAEPLRRSDELPEPSVSVLWPQPTGRAG